jgi:ribosomal protein S18 acetylase RimI-like enzyme
MIVREYRTSDFSQVESLWKETGIYNVERGDTASIIDRCNSEGGRFLVLEDPATGVIAGTSWLTWDGRRVFLHHFAIGTRYQGKGYGRMLALKSLEFARKKDCPVKLEVHKDNHAAMNLYSSLGFEAWDEYKIFMNLKP